MGSKISILGCGTTGIQTAVYLLEQHCCEVLIYDSFDVEYAKGMALDCMQASAIRAWQGNITAVDTIDTLSQSDILVITENTDNTLSDEWINLAKTSKCIVYAVNNTDYISDAIKNGVDKKSILGVHGLVNSRILAEVVADELNIAISDVHATIFGGIGQEMHSKPELVRVHGMPVNVISEGLFEKALSIAKSRTSHNEQVWKSHYTLSAAAVEIILIMESGLHTILPITSESGTYPSLIGNYAIQKVYQSEI